MQDSRAQTEQDSELPELDSEAQDEAEADALEDLWVDPFVPGL